MADSSLCPRRQSIVVILRSNSDEESALFITKTSYTIRFASIFLTLSCAENSDNGGNTAYTESKTDVASGS